MQIPLFGTEIKTEDSVERSIYHAQGTGWQEKVHGQKVAALLRTHLIREL